jgi:translation initiation factor 1
MMSRKKREGIVYSTNPAFQFIQGNDSGKLTLPPAQQQLYVWRDSKSRKGKTVTLVRGFSGRDEDLEQLARDLKSLCGAGGTAKDGEVLIQGDFREKVFAYLAEKGYRVKKAGG